MQQRYPRTALCALLVAIVLLSTVRADARKPVISIIIDDIGYSLQLAERALQLPSAVTLSILPFAPHSQKISQRAQAEQREFMLHIPMQGHEKQNFDPGMLTMAMTEDEFISSLRENLEAISGYSGVNNHKGSTLTTDAKKMRLLLQTLAEVNTPFIIDSKTSAASKINNYAREYGVPYASRNIFLDVNREKWAIELQFKRLLDIATERGYAIAIGHPYPETLDVLEALLSADARKGFLLLPVSQQLILNNTKTTIAYSK